MGESKNLWGGRFTGKSDPEFAVFNNSFRFDRRLFAADVQASLAYCKALSAADVITHDEADKIQSGLQTILDDATDNATYLEDASAEDVHSFVEARLVELAGEPGRKLHTGRSRNDQVATDMRLWLRDAIDEVSSRLRDAREALLDFAEANREIVIPGYTHLQR